jgi:nucleoid-associated protein YgaU
MANIYVKSRYRQTVSIQVPVYTPGISTKNVERRDAVFERRYTTWVSDTEVDEYVVVEGEYLFDIAYREYKDPTLWFVIADFNPEIFDLFNIPVGTTILVPHASLVDRIVGLT